MMSTLRISSSAMKRIIIKPISSSFSNICTKPKHVKLPQLIFSRSFSSSDNKKDTTDVAPKNLKEKFKELYKKYGKLFVGTYIGVYITTLASLFITLDLDLLNAATFGVDAETSVLKFCELMETLTGNKDYPEYVREHPRVGTFAIAWIMTKFTEPLRFGITVVTLPQIAKMLGHKDQEKSESQ